MCPSSLFWATTGSAQCSEGTDQSGSDKCELAEARGDD